VSDHTNPIPEPVAGSPAEVRSTDGVRLQKVLANAGVASRRVAENLISGVGCGERRRRDRSSARA